MSILLLDNQDIQDAFAQYLKGKRKKAKLSRAALAEKSCVPAPTIKKFETTGQISFRQLLLLWETLDDLTRLYQLTQQSSEQAIPRSIHEVLGQ